MPLLICLNSAAARLQRLYYDILADTDPTGSLRTQKALMSGKTQDINSHLLHMNWKYASRLSSIYCEQNSFPLTKSTDICDIDVYKRQLPVDLGPAS